MSLYELPVGYEMRMRILESIAQSLASTTFDQLSVMDICARAGISRKTFYRYFLNKFDAINWYQTQFDNNSLTQIGRTLTWEEGHLQMNKNLVSEANFFVPILKSRIEPDSLIPFVISHNAEEFKRTIIEFNNLELTPVLEFQANFWAKIAAEIGVDWLLKGRPQSPEELTELLCTCIPCELYSAMNEPVLKRRNQAAQR